MNKQYKLVIKGPQTLAIIDFTAATWKAASEVANNIVAAISAATWKRCEIVTLREVTLREENKND